MKSSSEPATKMIALLDTSEDLKVCETEIGCKVEQLLTPLTRFRVQYPKEMRAIENGGFAGFKEKAYLALLDPPRLEAFLFPRRRTKRTQKEQRTYWRVRQRERRDRIKGDINGK